MESVILKSVWRVKKMDNNYQLSRIHNYINGLMSKEDMYAFEHEALEDPLLQDAIDGYKMQQGVDVKQISLLQQRLTTRVEAQGGERSKRFYSWQRLTIGLAAAVMFITVCSLLLIRYIPRINEAKMKEIVISDAIYDYSISPYNANSNALPVGGWEKLYEVLNLGYSNYLNYQGTLLVEFQLDAAKNVIDLRISGHNFEQDEELMDIIRNKIKWTGSQGSFNLEIHKISL